jgi:hypothetical protein
VRPREPEKRVKQLFAFGLTLALLCGGDAMACSCTKDRSPVPELVAKAYRKASFVAEIEVVSKSTVSEAKEVSGERWSEKDQQNRPYTETITHDFVLMEINILKLWKGSPDVKSIATGLGGGDCGLPFDAGQKVLVYGYAMETPDRVSIGACSRTRLLNDAAEDVEILDELGSTKSR